MGRTEPFTHRVCPDCEGKGKVIQHKVPTEESRARVAVCLCPGCDGTGMIPLPEAPPEKETPPMTFHEALSALRQLTETTQPTPFLEEALRTMEALAVAEDEFREALNHRDAEIATLSTVLATRDRESGYDDGFRDGFRRGIDESQGFPDRRLTPGDPLPGPVIPYPAAPYDDSLIIVGAPLDDPHPPGVSYTVYHEGQQVGSLQFQRGAVGAGGSTRGVFDTHLLAILSDRLTRFVKRSKDDPRTARALYFVQAALTELVDRRDTRHAGGILGTDEP